MAVVNKTVLVPFSAAQMFSLVDRVEDYPQFLPWCGGVEVKNRTDDSLEATLKINFHGVRQSFSTRNTNQRPDGMTMELVDGPFRSFHGQWRFKALREDACKIEFELQYEFSTRLLDTIIGPVFGMIANSFVDSFCKRAETVYGAAPA